MATKKTTQKAKAKPAPKATAKKSANAQKPQTATKALKSLAILPTIKSQGKDTRRKPPNDPLSEDNITIIATAFNAIRDILADTAAVNENFLLENISVIRKYMNEMVLEQVL